MSLLASAATAAAAGRESPRWSREDLVVSVDSRWAGCADGGYYPIRFRITNSGPKAKVTLRFEPESGNSGRGLPAVAWTQELDQNATVQDSLPIPMTGLGMAGWLRLEKNDEQIEEFGEHIDLPEPSRTIAPQPSLLIISPTNVDAYQFGLASTSLANAPMAYGGHHGSSGPRPADFQWIPPDLLPKSWIDYSGVDLVAIPLGTLTALSGDHRQPLLDWVHTGGTLVVYNVGGRPADSQELAAALEADSHAAVSPWWPADPALRQALTIVEIHPGGGTTTTTSAFHENAPGSWPGSADAFARRKVLLGQVCAFADSPFPGTPHDWAWLLRSVGSTQYHWPTRHGVSARRPSEEFLDFLIPGTGGVPVVAFVVLMTLFTLVIGPLNYLWLWKKKRISLLLATIPAVAFVTSLALFAWSAVSAGFGVKSRVRSLTVLDQSSGTAVSVGRVSLYAGLASSDGLQFPPETAVYPVWPEGDRGGSQTGSVDWSDGQILGSGWLRSRTRTQFLTVGHREQRGRLEVGTPDGTSVEVTNGLEWDLDSVILCAADGDLYAGRGIGAGASATLHRATSEDYTALAGILRENVPAPPDGVEAMSFQTGRHYDPYLGWIEPLPYRFSQSWMELRIDAFEMLGSNPDALAPRSYFAVTGQNPGVDTGVEDAAELASTHLILGHY